MAEAWIVATGVILIFVLWNLWLGARIEWLRGDTTRVEVKADDRTKQLQRFDGRIVQAEARCEKVLKDFSERLTAIAERPVDQWESLVLVHDERILALEEWRDKHEAESKKRAKKT